MALNDFSSPEAWTADLDQRWPERPALRDMLVTQVMEAASTGNASPAVLELCFGAGDLLVELTRALPAARVVGVDREPGLAVHVAERVGAQVELVTADLNDRSWVEAVAGPFHVVYSMQSFHDLGDATAQGDVYRAVRTLLAPGGRLVNVDFVVPRDEEDRRRLPLATHEALLREIGFVEVDCRPAAGDLGLVTARAP